MKQVGEKTNRTLFLRGNRIKTRS